MDTLKIMKQMLSRFSFSQMLPYYAYDKENEVYQLGHGVGFVFECDQTWGGQSTADPIKSLYYQQFPPGTSIQYMIYASPNVTYLMDKYVHVRENIPDAPPGMLEIAAKKKEFVVAGSKKTMLRGLDSRARNFRHIISVVIPCEDSPSGYDQGNKTAARIKPSIMQALNTAHLNPREMPPEEFLNLMIEILNPSHNYETQHYDQKIAVREQMIYADNIQEVKKDYMIIDGKFVRSFTVKQYPEKWDITNNVDFPGSLSDNVKQIPCPFMIVLNTEYPDKVKEVGKVQKKALGISYQLFGPMAKWFPELADKKMHFDSYLKQMTTAGDSPVWGYMNIFLYADSPDELESMSSLCLNLYRSLGFVLQVDTYITLPMFLNAIPLGYQKDAQEDLRRKKTLKASDIAELVPISSDWGGFGKPVINLISRRGQVQFFDIFSNPVGGYSGIVVAGTGAGKSFFVNELITSYLSIGAKIWVIDAGRSYEKLCSFCNGQFMVFDMASNICLNPFSDIVNIDEEMPILKSIVAQMVSMNTLDDLSMAYIEEAIKEQYAKHGNNMTVSNIADALNARNEPFAGSIAKRLFSYTSSGAYAGFFEGKANMQHSTNLTVMELDELKSKKDLQEVVLLSLIYQIQQAMADRSQYKLLIIDEAWDLLTGGNTTHFMETAYRRFRKYKGACFSITQSVNDFYRLPSGVAIVENSDFMFLLRQKTESIRMLKESGRVSLTDGLYKLLSSVWTDSGNFSEIFVYTPIGITVGRLIVDRFTQLLYTTKPEEYTAVKKHLDEGCDINMAIQNVMEEENRSITR